MKLTKNYLRSLILEVFSEKEATSLLRSGTPDFSDPDLTNKIIQVFQEIIEKSKSGNQNKDFTPNKKSYLEGIKACKDFLKKVKGLSPNDPRMVEAISETLSILFSGQADYNPMNQLQGSGLINNDDKWYLMGLSQINRSGGIKTQNYRLQSS